MRVYERFHFALYVSLAFTIGILPVATLAATPVQFTKTELEAFVTLVKPEQTSVRLDGRKGEFRPGPALVFAGLEPQDFDINLNLGADLVDLHFHELRAGTPSVSFTPGHLRVEIGFVDQEKAIRSTLGAIHFRGVKVVATLSVSSSSGVRVNYDQGEILGELKGTGLLKAKWVIDAIKKNVLKSLKTEVERTLSRASVQTSIEKGLLTWAQFSTERSLTHVTADSVAISEAGLSFQAE